MSKADMTRLINHARVRLPGALPNVINLEIFATVNEFLQNSNLWYEDISVPVTHTDFTFLQNPDAYTYDVTPSLGAITRLGGVLSSSGVSKAAIMPQLGQLILGQSPEAADTYIVRVFLTVTDPVASDGTPQFPSWIINKYGTDLLDGLLGRMMSQIAKPYSNNAAGSMHYRRFKSAISQAKVEAAHQNIYNGRTWSFPRGFSR